MLFSTNTIKPQPASGTYIVQFSPLLHTLLIAYLHFSLWDDVCFWNNLNINHMMPEKWLFNLVGVFYVGPKKQPQQRTLNSLILCISLQTLLKFWCMNKLGFPCFSNCNNSHFTNLPSKWKKWFLRMPRPIINAAIPLGRLSSSCSGWRSLARDWRQVGQEVSFSNQDLKQELNNRESSWV